MRKIKFRAWDKNNKTMNYLVDFPMLAGYIVVYIEIDEDIYSSVEWQQFTGVKDKNGKEIYEGDIIKLIGDFDDEEISPVIFREGQFTTSWSSQSLGILLTVYNGNIEIIGNIYENKELLDGPKSSDSAA